MGRWAQQRRRGGASALPAILRVEFIDNQNVRVTFSGSVGVDGVVGPDGSFKVATAAVASVTAAGPAIVDVELDDLISAGDPWTLTAQPNWLTTAVRVPASGVLT